MKVKKVFRTILILMIFGLNISCDQISKNIVRQRIDSNKHISLINNHLTLTKVENTGAFLSLGQFLPHSIKVLLLVILPIIVLIVSLMFVIIKTKLSNMTVTGICFIAGGGFGNLYDRLIHGSVTDFLHIDFVLFQTGIFNIADVSIMTGLFVILLEIYLQHRKLKFGLIDKHNNE